METTRVLIVFLMICLVPHAFLAPSMFLITYLSALHLINYLIHLSEVTVLETFDMQRLEGLMRLERTDCVCDELLCAYCYYCPLHVSDNLVYCFMADKFSNMAK